jgi:hypothetical protein
MVVIRENPADLFFLPFLPTRCTGYSKLSGGCEVRVLRLIFTVLCLAATGAGWCGAQEQNRETVSGKRLASYKRAPKAAVAKNSGAAGGVHTTAGTTSSSTSANAHTPASGGGKPEASHPAAIPAPSRSISNGNRGGMIPRDRRGISGNDFQPASMFDALTRHLQPVVTTVEVRARVGELETSEPAPFETGGQDVLASAGTFGDVSRYLQTLPGVVATSDLSNEVLVRGGHPMENLFVVDGIEIPNINHMATMGTTGGFGPMIDSGVIQSVKLFTGGYDARYPERLSSVTEIHTLDPEHLTTHLEADAGIQGFGGLLERGVRGGDLLVSAHHGLLDIMNSVGISGLPSYTNQFARYRHNDSQGNRLTLLEIAGWDSLKVSPCETDTLETSSIDSQYTGWRETTGAEWQHIFSSHAFGMGTVTDSEQVEHIGQQEQILVPSKVTFKYIPCPIPASVFTPTPVYTESTDDGFNSASYRFELSGTRISFSAGSAFWLQRPHFNIDQPLGAYSPYSVDPVRRDSTSFASDFSSGETGTFAEATAHPLKSLSLSAGGRLQTFAFGDHTTITPRLSARYSISEHVSVHAAFAQYAQMPPFVYLLSYAENRTMLPMRDTHEIVGMDLGILPDSEIHVEAYNKIYRDIPSSTEYPQVNLHDMVDMLSQQFVWLPMNSFGEGKASGIEISDLTRVRSSLVVRGSLAYSRAMFAGNDGVVRPSNFDFPWIANIAGLKRFGRGYEIAGRYGYATGRPYTPYDMPDSLAQNRPIYDVMHMNSMRVQPYGRLDVQMNKDAIVHKLHMEIYAGVNNVLNRSNFLAYVWLTRDHPSSKTRNPVDEIDQMSIFPNAGIRYIFR